MLVADIVRRVRNATGDVAVLQFSNSTLTDWINDAIRECVNENSLLQGKANSNTVAAQQDYALPPDIFKIHSVYVDGQKIPILTLSEWEDKSFYQNDSGLPVASMIYVGVLSLYPKPDKVYSLVINYTKAFSEILYTAPGGVDTWNPNTPAIPDSFHPRIVTYCLAQVAFQDDDYEKYNALMMNFKTGVDGLKHLKDETENLYPFIHYVDRDLEG